VTDTSADLSLQRTALAAVCLSAFTAPLMLSAVNVAIPAIAESLHINAVKLSWVPTAYLLTSAVLLLPFGKLADLYGRKRVLLSGMIVITAASILASTAQSAAMLIACRVLQGIGAAMLFATGVAILSSVFPRDRRGGAIGLSVSAVYFGLTFGPLIGGWVTHHFSWRGVFLVHLPLVLFNIAIVATLLRGEWKDESPARFDLAGAVLYAAAITGVMVGLSLLPALHGIVLIAAGLAAFAGFFRLERRVAAPLFDVTLFFQNRVFTFSCLAALMMYSSTFATSYLMSLYLQFIQGLSAQAAGAVILAQPLVMALCSPLFGRLSDRYEPRVLASCGMALTATGLLLLSTLSPASPLAAVYAFLIIAGLGFSLFSSPNVNAIMGSVDRRYLGTASGAVATMRVLGQMFSMGIVALVFAVLMGPVHITPEQYPVLLSSIRTSFIAAACLCAAGILLSLARGDVHGNPAGRDSCS
jgi:EmrB/QacA subfamily drug resistance transporter